MSENRQTKKAFDRLAKSNDSYTGKQLLKSLYKCRQGCYQFSLVLLNNSTRESCNEDEKAALLRDSRAYSLAADRTQMFISNLDNYDNID